MINLLSRTQTHNARPSAYSKWLCLIRCRVLWLLLFVCNMRDWAKLGFRIVRAKEGAPSDDNITKPSRAMRRIYIIHNSRYNSIRWPSRDTVRCVYVFGLRGLSAHTRCAYSHRRRAGLGVRFTFMRLCGLCWMGCIFPCGSGRFVVR